jgi:hypothetical protein
MKKNSKNLEKKRGGGLCCVDILVYMYEVLNIIIFNSITEVSISSKLQAYCSLQRHHIKYNGANLHTTKIFPRLTQPPQLTKKSLTLLGITQSTPKE